MGESDTRAEPGHLARDPATSATDPTWPAAPSKPTPSAWPATGTAAPAFGHVSVNGTPASGASGASGPSGASGGPADGRPESERESAEEQRPASDAPSANGGQANGGQAHGGASEGDKAADGGKPADSGTPDGAGPQGDGAGRERRAAPAGASGSEGAEPEVFKGPLPDGVRQRVIALAADGLGAMTVDEIPVPLRQFARFTPSRRAKLAATPLAGVLENDPVFRQRIAERLRRGLPDLAAALESGRTPAAADPLDVAAAAYLLRPRGWTTLLDTAGRAAEKAAQDRAGAEAAAVVDRLESELGGLRASTKAEHDKLRAELEEARKEAEQLRRQVRGLQGGAKHAEKEAKRAQAELATVRAEAQAAIAAADKETRRLRGRVAEVESALEASKRAAREGRSMEDTRVRLLLDTVLEAAQGLRRELALPPVGIRPADMVDAVAPEASGTKDIAQRALEGDDPAILDQLLSLPQAHLVIDGYNVTKTGYPSLALSEQRVRLLGGLAVIAAQTGCEITCVFDGANLDAPVLLAPPRGVRVRFSKAGETADELIRRLVRAEPPGRPVIVVSSDREVADGVRRTGARPVQSSMLLRRLARG
ncbi:NYN domain-containing protein [Yinghuangia seranimata]|uniref:NYN domain-containing protein n=1 Tax=Yinghuangia seranimata TaxID=408067 RepID=UPI00248C75BB|nr:NYN domain-containing protein [Yinghuangia seranimata]MDI2126114.1 NYN domain-containing protein [Yinghuangia seranimata]